MEDFIIYSAGNILITPLIDDADEKKDEIYYAGILINLFNNIIYENLFEGKLIILPYQEEIFKVSFQTFINSMLFDSITPCLIDGLLVLGSVVLKKKIDKKW